jgi:diadenosine tetraphosphate (Ap4A) HIT family hydrolase
VTTSCYACRHSETAVEGSSPEAIHVEEGWRVAHAFNSALPGWLVLVPLRHVTAVEDLTAAEAAAMGALLRRCGLALREVTGCQKTYFMFFAEAEGFSHLHVHVVPRMDWFEREQTGARVFSLLGVPESEAVPVEEQVALASRLRAALAATGGA